MGQYLALLRGINVGGNNLIRMTELKTCFEAQGFANVATYIQSGNVLFDADPSDRAVLTGRLEDALSRTFNYKSRVVLRSHAQLQAVVAHAPKGFGSQRALHRYDVIFLKEPLTAAEAMQDVKTREGVDEAFAGDGTLYFSRLISRAAQSNLRRIIALPVYQHMTIRNWNTTTRLLTLMNARG